MSIGWFSGVRMKVFGPIRIHRYEVAETGEARTHARRNMVQLIGAVEIIVVHVVDECFGGHAVAHLGQAGFIRCIVGEVAREAREIEPVGRAGRQGVKVLYGFY